MHDPKGSLEFIRIDLIDKDAVPDPRLIPSSKAQDDADRESIKRHGLLQPLVVGPMPDKENERNLVGHPLIAGRRRYRLCKSLGMTRVPCYVREEESTKANLDGLFRDLAAAENIHRADMHAVEIAAEVQRRANLGHKHRAIAEALKLGLSNVGNYARVAKAPFFGAMLEDVKGGKPVPSYRKCLAILEEHKAPSDGDKDPKKRDAWADAVLKAYGNACVAEAAAIEAHKQKPQGKGAADKPQGKAKGGGGSSVSFKPRKWAEVRDWWKEAQRAIKSGVHPVTKAELADAESISLKACNELLEWVYKTKKKAEPPIFVMGPVDEAAAAAEGDADASGADADADEA